ncbi:MAG: winged helix-turn-helix domain-containing protein [Proteobacteria bacterium]|nr:winged helix-turn-helix domain-containing protein [Pseudomonadota bacterium]
MKRPEKSLLRVGDLDFDRRRQTVRRHGVLLDIPDLSFRLFEALIDHAPDRVGKDELIREVWGDVVVGDETLAQRVRLLRQALGDGSQAPRYIASVRGRGYRLICSVAPADADESRAASRSFWPIGVATIVLAAGAWWFAGQDSELDVPAIRAGALAVLPFQDMSAAGDHQFFADGMHEELLSRLAMINNLAVISRTSVEKYRGSSASLPEIATELGAGTIIEGSVRVEEDRLRITVQLIDAETDEHIWTESYDRELSLHNIFAIQQEVAEKVARALEVEYASTDLSLIELPTNDLEAYNLYLLGRYHTFKQTPDDLERAIVYLQNATMLDNQFAGAYATLGWAYSFLGTGYGHQLPDDVYPKAKEAALRAIALDSELADARSLYADILTWSGTTGILTQQNVSTLRRSNSILSTRSGMHCTCPLSNDTTRRSLRSNYA